MSKPVSDIGASVRARLLALSREKGRAFDLLLTRYALEPATHAGRKRPVSKQCSCSQQRHGNPTKGDAPGATPCGRQAGTNIDVAQEVAHAGE